MPHRNQEPLLHLAFQLDANLGTEERRSPAHMVRADRHRGHQGLGLRTFHLGRLGVRARSEVAVHDPEFKCRHDGEASGARTSFLNLMQVGIFRCRYDPDAAFRVT